MGLGKRQRSEMVRLPQNTQMTARSIVILVAVLAAIGFAWNFAMSGPGALASNGSPCRELLSTGNDDEVCFLFLTLLLLPAALRLWRLEKPIVWWERVAFFPLFLFGSIFIFAGADCADWIVTFKVSGDPNLIAILLLLPILALFYLLPNRR